jgi:hypothetical protein
MEENKLATFASREQNNMHEYNILLEISIYTCNSQ